MLGIFLAPLALAIIGYGVFVILRKQKKNERSSKITTEYASLIKLLCDGSNAVDTKIGTRSVKISFLKNKERYSFHFSEVDSRLIVVWTLESSQHGKRGKEWSFNTQFDQQLMFNEISADLGLYTKVLYREK